MSLEILFLILAALIAGFIDSIAGGGGLITVPTFSILLGPGVEAIATNKVAATAASLTALIVYIKNGHVSLKGNLRFTVIVGLAAGLGSQLAPYFPPAAFKWFLLVICPLILWIVWKKDLWVQQEISVHVRPIRWRLWIAGFICGLYDGIAGPGGGTLMFLSLLIFGRLPLLMALGTAKLANLASASVSLGSYAFLGLVHWREGAFAGIAIAVGALIGAEVGSRRSAVAIRLMLTVVVALLLLRLAIT